MSSPVKLADVADEEGGLGEFGMDVAENVAAVDSYFIFNN